MQGVLLAITPHGAIIGHRIKAAPDYRTLQAIVGGRIETVPYFAGPVEGEVAFNNSDAEVSFTDHAMTCVAFCNEEGKLEGQPYNATATAMWRDITPYAIDDVLVGVVAVVIGDAELMAEL